MAHDSYPVNPHILSFYRSCRNSEPGALYTSLLQLLKVKGGNGEPGVSGRVHLHDQLIRHSFAGAADRPPVPQLMFRPRDIPSPASKVIQSICLRCLVLYLMFFSPFVKQIRHSKCRERHEKKIEWQNRVNRKQANKKLSLFCIVWKLGRARKARKTHGQSEGWRLESPQKQVVREASGRSLGDAASPFWGWPMGPFSHQSADAVTGALGMEPLGEVSAQSRFGRLKLPNSNPRREGPTEAEQELGYHVAESHSPSG